MFEKLVADSNGEAKRLADFLGTTLSGQILLKGNNTSFTSNKRQDLTETEAWICEHIAGKAMKLAGYNLKNSHPKFQDISDLLITSKRFFLYQIQRVFKRKDKRSSVYAYLKCLFNRPLA